MVATLIDAVHVTPAADHNAVPKTSKNGIVRYSSCERVLGDVNEIRRKGTRSCSR
jgi:hypothetical protein